MKSTEFWTVYSNLHRDGLLVHAEMPSDVKPLCGATGITLERRELFMGLDGKFARMSPISGNWYDAEGKVIGRRVITTKFYKLKP